MGVKRLEDLVAYQLALEFKKRVYALVRENPEAFRDYRYRSQLFEAVEGDFFTVLGLPLWPVLAELLRAGVLLT